MNQLEGIFNCRYSHEVWHQSSRDECQCMIPCSFDKVLVLPAQKRDRIYNNLHRILLLPSPVPSVLMEPSSWSCSKHCLDEAGVFYVLGFLRRGAWSSPCNHTSRYPAIKKATDLSTAYTYSWVLSLACPSFAPLLGLRQ